MPSRSISLCFACTLTVFALASHVYLARARPLRSGFPVFRAHGRPRRPLRPRTGDRPRRAQPPRRRHVVFPFPPTCIQRDAGCSFVHSQQQMLHCTSPGRAKYLLDSLDHSQKS
eukprot:699779-Pleurochrysis_carterae.AAC.2